MNTPTESLGWWFLQICPCPVQRGRARDKPCVWDRCLAELVLEIIPSVRGGMVLSRGDADGKKELYSPHQSKNNTIFSLIAYAAQRDGMRHCQAKLARRGSPHMPLDDFSWGYIGHQKTNLSTLSWTVCFKCLAHPAVWFGHGAGVVTW